MEATESPGKEVELVWACDVKRKEGGGNGRGRPKREDGWTE